MYLRRDGHVATGDEALDINIKGMEIVTLPGGAMRLYTGTGAYGGLTSWQIDGAGLPGRADQVAFPDWTAASVNGLALWVDDAKGGRILIGGASGLLSYDLTATGQIAGLEVISGLAPGSDRISDIAGAPGGLGVTYIADQGSNQVIGYQMTGAGDYAAIGEAARQATDGVAQLCSVSFAQGDYLLLADTGIQGVASYEIAADSGALTPVASVGMAEGLGVATPTAMEIIEAFGTRFVILGAAGSSSLSVMRLSPQGALEVTDHLIDGRQTRFGGLTAMAVEQIDDRVFVLAGGADDGMSLFTLLPDGRLLHLETLVHGLGDGLMNVSAIAVHIAGDRLRAYVTSATEGGISQFFRRSRCPGRCAARHRRVDWRCR